MKGDRVSVPLKTKILHTVKHMLKKHWNKIAYEMDWKAHWFYLLSLINRENRFDAFASHNVLLDHLKAISSFLFSTRQYFNVGTSSSNSSDSSMPSSNNGPQGIQGDEGLSTTETTSLLDYAMEKLSDLRLPVAIEGLLALVLCLPTDFPHYDTYLPKWFEIWSTLDHNHAWDACWLLLVSRARKTTTTSSSSTSSFNWTAVLPFLLTKGREILNIPNVAGVSNVNSNSFPKSLPTFYHIVLQQFKDLNTKIISKLSKIIFHCIVSEGERSGTGAATAAVTNGQSGQKDQNGGQHVQGQGQPGQQQQGNGNERKSCVIESFMITPPSLVMINIKNLGLRIPGITEEINFQVNSSTVLLCQFFQSIRPLLHSSNSNTHVMNIGRFIEVFINSIAKMIGKEIGLKLLNGKKASSNEGQTTTRQTSSTTIDQITWNTLQYLEGVFLIIALESINSKNTVVRRVYISCLNQLLSLNSTFTHLIVPFLLDALDPKAVTQPQRTIASLSAFTTCIRTLLYPNPLVLRYLPDILRLSLPGMLSCFFFFLFPSYFLSFDLSSFCLYCLFLIVYYYDRY
jgi:hypothetical protein